MPMSPLLPCFLIWSLTVVLHSGQLDEDLEDFHAQMAQSQQDDGSLSGSIQHELEFNSSDESERLAEQAGEKIVHGCPTRFT